MLRKAEALDPPCSLAAYHIVISMQASVEPVRPLVNMKHQKYYLGCDVCGKYMGS